MNIKLTIQKWIVELAQIAMCAYVFIMSYTGVGLVASCLLLGTGIGLHRRLLILEDRHRVKAEKTCDRVASSGSMDYRMTDWNEIVPVDEPVRRTDHESALESHRSGPLSHESKRH